MFRHGTQLTYVGQKPCFRAQTVATGSGSRRCSSALRPNHGLSRRNTRAMPTARRKAKGDINPLFGTDTPSILRRTARLKNVGGPDVKHYKPTRSRSKYAANTIERTDALLYIVTILFYYSYTVRIGARTSTITLPELPPTATYVGFSL